MARKNLLVTPRGIAAFPFLTNPYTKFVPEGVYSVKLCVPAADAQELVAFLDRERAKQVDAARVEHKLKTVRIADPPYRRDEETGDVTFSFKMRASGVNKQTGETWTRSPAIFDATGAPYAERPRIGAGSTLRVSFELLPFYTAMIGAGLSLRLVAVQVIDLVEWDSQSASSYGFAADALGSARVPAPAEEAPDDEPGVGAVMLHGAGLNGPVIGGAVLSAATAF